MLRERERERERKSKSVCEREWKRDVGYLGLRTCVEDPFEGGACRERECVYVCKRIRERQKKCACTCEGRGGLERAARVEGSFGGVL